MAPAPPLLPLVLHLWCCPLHPAPTVLPVHTLPSRTILPGLLSPCGSVIQLLGDLQLTAPGSASLPPSSMPRAGRELHLSLSLLKGPISSSGSPGCSASSSSCWHSSAAAITAASLGHVILSPRPWGPAVVPISPGAVEHSELGPGRSPGWLQPPPGPAAHGWGLGTPSSTHGTMGRADPCGAAASAGLGSSQHNGQLWDSKSIPLRAMATLPAPALTRGSASRGGGLQGWGRGVTPVLPSRTCSWSNRLQNSGFTRGRRSGSGGCGHDCTAPAATPHPAHAEWSSMQN